MKRCMQLIVGVSIIGLAMVSLSYSANVTISGMVTDSTGAAIAGAEVKLLVGGQNTTTGSDGSFHLLGNDIGITAKPAQSQLYQPVVSIAKGILKMHIHEQSSVNILTYNLQGCLITSIHKTLSAGDHSIALSNKSSGIYLYKIQINNNYYQIMSNSLRSYAVSANTTQETSAYSLSKQAKSLIAIDDTIRIKKAGYFDYLVPVHTSDTSGITVKMHTFIFPAMVNITGGTFVMGSYDTVDFSMAVPAHSVTLSTFSMSKNLITQELYQAVMGTNPSHWVAAKRPVEQINWYSAILFCNKLSKLAGLDTVYTYTDADPTDNALENVVINYSKNGYRLPTEAEFEYACRAGTTTDFYWGRNYPPTTHADSLALDSNAVWYGNNPDSTAVVGTKKPNAWGLYDMSGNLFTWCNDRYSGSYDGVAGGLNPSGSTEGDQFVCRGGSWGFFNCGDIVTYPLASPFRWEMWQFMTSWSVGLRVVQGQH